MPTTETASATVYQARHEICEILGGTDRRLLVVCGPCSIHDAQAAREYAGLLRNAIAEFSTELRIVMRVYFEKPRTTVGWKGLINDPHLDQSYKINDGLRLARRLLLDLAEMGVPAGTEFLDMITPQYLAGLVSWGAIGARTTESQVHRQLVSGLSCPVGFKNATSGDVQIAIEAVLSACSSAHVPGTHPSWAIGHIRHHRQPGLPRDPARGTDDGELHSRCGRPGVQAATGVGTATTRHDRLQPRQQQQRPYAAACGLPRCRRTDCRGQPEHHRRHAGKQSGRGSAETCAGRTAGVRAEHHRCVYGTGTKRWNCWAELAKAVRAGR